MSIWRRVWRLPFTNRRTRTLPSTAPAAVGITRIQWKDDKTHVFTDVPLKYRAGGVFTEKQLQIRVGGIWENI